MGERTEISRRYKKFNEFHSEFFANRQKINDEKFNFLDLFAGIGGIRLALENLGGKCAFSSEWDDHCKETYRYNFGEIPHGDIHQVSLSEIPDANILAGGFPCQPFSSIGRRQGFTHETQGNLFFRIIEILDHLKSRPSKGPDVVLLENVGGLTTLKHDGERVIESVVKELENVGYAVSYDLLDAADFGVPQHRTRVYIVGIKKKLVGTKLEFNWSFPLKTPPDIGRLLESNVDGYSITNHLQKVYMYKKDDGRPQRVNVDSVGAVKTLVSTYHKIQRLTGTFVEDGPTGLRLLTRNECRDIMGFPKDFLVPDWVSRTQAYRQFGNSVAPPVVEAVAGRILEIVSAKKIELRPRYRCIT